MNTDTRPISIAIAALGGQGGSVLSDWIVDLAENNAYYAQATSVPGVAQRTGATIYYLEIFPQSVAEQRGAEPVLALYPVPGDVAIVLATEIVEAGRAIQRGLVTPGMTTLIASSHRVYVISELTAQGNGIVDHRPILEAARMAAKEFICFDMAEASEKTSSIINAVLFGALAGSGALPFERSAFEDTIRRSGRAVESNLAGFAKGFDTARGAPEETPRQAESLQIDAEQSVAGKPAAAALLERARRYPETCQEFVIEALRRTSDFQDFRYAATYLGRLDTIHALDKANGGADKAFALTREMSRYLALRMCFEDTIRVADLKTRASRFKRFREEVKAEPGQHVQVIEYLHPRVEEICDLLPRRLGSYILRSPRVRRLVDKLVNRRRKLKTSKLIGFLPMYLLARMRPLRRFSYRYHVEQEWIQLWLDRVAEIAPKNYALALEIIECARLIKGYGATHERGLNNFSQIMNTLTLLPANDESAEILSRLRDAAMTDEHGTTLGEVLKEVA